jgi:hypothetical protein
LEFEITEYRFTGVVIEIVNWEMPINGTTWASNANRHPQGLNSILEGIKKNIIVDLTWRMVY